MHRYFGRKLASELGLDPSWVERVDALIDDPVNYVKNHVENEAAEDAIACLEERGVDPRVLGALKAG